MPSTIKAKVSSAAFVGGRVHSPDNGDTWIDVEVMYFNTIGQPYVNRGGSTTPTYVWPLDLIKEYICAGCGFVSSNVKSNSEAVTAIYKHRCAGQQSIRRTAMEE